MVPSAPININATKGTLTNSVQVAWVATPNAATYTVATGASSTGPWSVLATGVTGTSYNVPDTSAPIAYYTVSATSASAGASAYGTPDTGYPNIAPTAASAH